MNAFTYRFILYPLRETYRKILRPKTKGVKVMVRFHDEILLIKNTYGKRHLWTLPGGGVNRKESLSEAAKREIREEVGIKLRDLKKLGIVQEKKDTKHIFLSRVENKNQRIDKNEIKEAKWFALKSMPKTEEQTYSLQESLKLLK